MIYLLYFQSCASFTFIETHTAEKSSMETLFTLQQYSNLWTKLSCQRLKLDSWCRVALACDRHTEVQWTANHSGGQMRTIKEHFWHTGCFALFTLFASFVNVDVTFEAASSFSGLSSTTSLCPIWNQSLAPSIILTDCWTRVSRCGCQWWDDLKQCHDSAVFKPSTIQLCSLYFCIHPYFGPTVKFHYFSAN